MLLFDAVEFEEVRESRLEMGHIIHLLVTLDGRNHRILRRVLATDEFKNARGVPGHLQEQCTRCVCDALGLTLSVQAV